MIRDGEKKDLIRHQIRQIGSEVCKACVSESPEGLLKMQSSGSQSKPTESDPLGHLA